MRLCFALFAAAGIACASGTAQASPPSAGRSVPLVMDIDSQAGWVEGQHSGGVDLGATARIRYHMLTAGMSLQGATIVFGSMVSASTVGGVAIPIGFVRLDALAEVGVNAYTNVGSNFLSDDPGADGTQPFVGARLSALARIHENRNGASIWIGPAFQYAKDIRSTTRTYTYRDESQDWFTGEYTNERVTESVHIGQSRYSFLAVVGVTVPL